MAGLRHLAQYAPVFGRQPYWQRVKAAFGSALIGYWPLWDAAGVEAVDLSGAGRAGTYRNNAGVLNGITLGQAGIGDRKASALFDGAAGTVNVYSASLNTAFNNQEGTIAIWFKAAAAGVWTDATERWIMAIGAAWNNVVYLSKHSTNNQLRLYYAAGGTWTGIQISDVSSTGWNHLALTWSKSGDVVRVYLNGAQQGPDQAGLGVWAGELAIGACTLGADSTLPTVLWSGCLAHALVLNRPATAAEVAKLVQSPFDDTVYLGGSITNGAGASVDANCWRSLLGAWLCARQPFGYGKRQAANFNAGVGGTPSWYGLVRMAMDVIAKGPECILIDFAVNDASAEGIGARSLGFAPAAEALIRRLRLECPAATLAINIFAWPDLYSGMDVNRRAARDRWIALAGVYGLKLYRWDTYLESLLGPGYNDAQVEAYLLAAGDVHPNDAGHDAIYDLIIADFVGFSKGSLAALPGYYEAEAADYEHEPQIVLGKDLTRAGMWAVDGNSVTSATADSTAAFTGTFCSFGWDTGFGAGQGVLAWKLDGGAYTSVDLAAQDVANKAIWDFARGAHTVTLKVVSGSIRVNRFMAI